MQEEHHGAVAAPRFGRNGAYVLFLLCLIYTLSFLDRQIVNILAEPIKRDLGLKDWQLGMLTGLAFAVLYTTLGIPIARLAERHNRVRIIAAALAVWSVFTAACGLAQSYLMLLLMRIGVGIGEAGCSPPAHSLITDTVPKERRAMALAIYSIGIPIGSLLGLALGGILADVFGWRVAFFVVGVPGILVAILALCTLREPRLIDAGDAQAQHVPGFTAAITELRERRAFWLLGAGAAMMAFINYGKIAFFGSFFLRNHGDELRSITAAIAERSGLELGPIALIGILLGVITGICGGLGTLFGGWMADHASRRDARAYATIPAIAALLQIPFFVAAMLVPSAIAAFVLLAGPATLSALWYGPVFAAVQGIVRPRVRNTAGALLQLIINLVGLGLGPLAVGVLSDVLGARLGDIGAGLRWSLVICASTSVIAAAAFAAARPRLKRELIS
jgi:MFS family permease